MLLTLGQVPVWLIGVLTALFLVICVVLILTVLIQRPTGGGLIGAFGAGSGSGQTVFGTKTGDALTVATIAMFVIYLLFAIGLNYAVRPVKGAATQQQQQATAPAEATPTPSAPVQPLPAPESATPGRNTPDAAPGGALAVPGSAPAAPAEPAPSGTPR